MKLKRVACTAAAVLMIGSCAMATDISEMGSMWSYEKENNVVRIAIPEDWSWKISNEDCIEMLTGGEKDEDGRVVTTFRAVDGATGYAQIRMSEDPDVDYGTLVTNWLVSPDGTMDDQGGFVQIEPGKDTNCVVSEDGKTLIVTLPGNPTTGYEWTYVPSNDGALELVSDEYKQDEAEEGMVGVGGSFVFTVKAAENPANAIGDLKFEYKRAGSDEYVECCQMVVAAGEDGKLVPMLSMYEIMHEDEN